MSVFTYIQMPPDGTGKKSAQTATVEIKYNNGTIYTFEMGDVVTTSSGLLSTVVHISTGSTSVTGEIYVKLAHGSIESVSAGETLIVDGVSYATVSVDTDLYYTQQVNLAGGNNSFNIASVDDLGSLKTTFNYGDPLFDAFGKMQTSETTTIREYQPCCDTMPDEFTEITNLGGSVSWDQTRHVVELSTPAGNIAALACRRSNLYHRYQTGVATTVIFSAFLGDTGKEGVVRRIGLFDDSDGIFFMSDENNVNGLAVVVRSSVSGVVVENVVYQTDWNIDRLDGSKGDFNISRKTLDADAVQVMFMDYQWLGAGRVRFGFVIDGKYIVCHEFNHANNISNPYMRTGTLPITMEQENVGSPSSPSYFYIISAAVKCEGKFAPNEYVKGGTVEPAEQFYNGSGLTVNITETVVDGVLTTSEISVNDGGTGYVVGDRIIISSGSNNAIAVVDTETGGVVTSLSIETGGSGYSDAIGVSTVIIPQYKHAISVRAIDTVNGIDNRFVSVPLFLHITDINGSNVPYLIEFVKNDTLGGTVNWIDPYTDNCLETATRSLSGVTSTSGGDVLLTISGTNNTIVDLTNIFNYKSQLMIRKAIITDEPDHYTLRIKPALSTENVTLLVGMTWKEYR